MNVFPTDTGSLCARFKVLVVDDNEDLALATAGVLEDEGHEVSVVFDGPAALRQAAISQPDVVLVDLGLPGMNGYEVAQALRQVPSEKPIRIFAVSGYAREEDRMRSRQSGCDDHLAKPLDFDKLFQLLGSF